MTTQTLTQQFLVEYVRGIIPAMLKSIKAAKRDGRLILAGVLAATYPHQAMWLTTLHGLEHLGWLVPAVVDLAMLRMFGVMQTAGMRRAAKVGALVMAGYFGAISITVNVAAPAHPGVRAIFAALVGGAIGVKIVVSLMGPDFRAMEARETEATAAVVTELEPVEAGPDPKRSEAARRAAQTRRDNAARAADEREARLARQRQARQERREAAKANATELFAAIAAQTEPGYIDSVAPISPAVGSASAYL